MKRKKRIWFWLGAALVFAVTFVLHDQAVFQKNEAARHIWKGVLQGEFFALFGALAGFWLALAGAALYWIAFDIIYNLLVVKKPLLYVGRTAQIDMFFRRIFGRAAGVAMLFIKVVFLVGALWMHHKKIESKPITTEIRA